MSVQTKLVRRSRVTGMMVASMLLLATSIAHAAPHFSVLALPPVDDEGPRIAVHWDGELPVTLEQVHAASGQGTRDPIQLDRPMTLLPAPADADVRYRIVDTERKVLAETMGVPESFGWQPTFTGPGLPSYVAAAAVYQDELIVAGDFITAGGVTVNHIARWDGSSWAALEGPAGKGIATGSIVFVSSLTVFDGELIVGGVFYQAGGVTVNHIARWDGNVWAALGGSEGTSIVGEVYALTVFDGELIVGGRFTQVGDVTVNNIARWDGSVWAALDGPAGTGTTTNGRVYALTVFDGALIAGGSFTQAGGVSVNHIARWDGSGWAALDGPDGTSVSGEVYSLAVFDGTLIVGGGFTQAGGVTVKHIARWDGNVWAALGGPVGTGMNSYVYSLTVFDRTLIAGGWFTQAGGVTANGIARWDGSEWAALDGPAGAGINGHVHALTVFDGTLIAGGFFTQAGGVTVNHIARWEGSAWAILDGRTGTGMDFGVSALTIYEDALIAGGSFTQAGDVTVNHIARWDGSAWASLDGPSGTGMNSDVRALAVFDGELIAGGQFFHAGGVRVNNIARWDGSAWATLSGPAGIGMTSGVSALTVFDDALIAGGSFTKAGGVTVNRIASWDGSAWSALDVGFDGTVHAMAEFDGALIAGGRFTHAGDVTVNRIARWDGIGWSALAGPAGTGITSDSSSVRALIVFDGGLIAGGNFAQAGGVTVNHIARWDGSGWSGLAGPAGTGMPSIDDTVYALTVSDGVLIAGGAFMEAGGVTVNNIAHWNGSAWGALDGPAATGMDSSVDVLTVVDGTLIAGGHFTQAGGVAAWRLAPYTRQPTVSEVLFMDPSTTDIGQPVLVSARVQGVTSAPDSGFGYVMASSGEFCETQLFVPLSGPGIEFQCELILSTPGQRELTAGYSGSAVHLPSEAAPIRIAVIEGIIFRNGFEPGW